MISIKNYSENISSFPEIAISSLNAVDLNGNRRTLQMSPLLVCKLLDSEL